MVRSSLAKERESIHRPLNHPLGCGDLGLADGCGRFDVDDDGVVGIDEIVGRVGKQGRSAVGTVQRAAGSAGEMNFGATGVAAPNAASSSTARYSWTARLAASGGSPADRLPTSTN